mmetsp:Transcript_17638/g.38437  ORF Transcript_17638/g.38437 Transcript_17638/m.38437 type:complete len:202 (+) Transcript_17638:185-790(+)
MCAILEFFGAFGSKIGYGSFQLATRNVKNTKCPFLFDGIQPQVRGTHASSTKHPSCCLVLEHSQDKSLHIDKICPRSSGHNNHCFGRRIQLHDPDDCCTRAVRHRRGCRSLIIHGNATSLLFGYRGSQQLDAVSRTVIKNLNTAVGQCRHNSRTLCRLNIVEAGINIAIVLGSSSTGATKLLEHFGSSQPKFATFSILTGG